MLVFLSRAPLLLLLAGDQFPKDVAARPEPPPKQRDATAGPSDQQSAASSCGGYAILRGEKAPDDALAREQGAMGLL